MTAIQRMTKTKFGMNDLKRKGLKFNPMIPLCIVCQDRMAQTMSVICDSPVCLDKWRRFCADGTARRIEDI